MLDFSPQPSLEPDPPSGTNGRYLLIFSWIFRVREAFHGIRSAILIHPEVSTPPEQFSGNMFKHFFVLFVDDWRCNF